MREALLFFDRPAQQVIAEAAAWLAQRHLRVTYRTPFSVAFADSTGAAAQLAAVPVQLRAGWCRVWLSVEGDGLAAVASEEYLAEHRDASRRAGTVVQRLERDLYADDRWPAYEAQLRASLSAQGSDPSTTDAKIAAFRQRWLALARKAAAAPPEEPDPA